MMNTLFSKKLSKLSKIHHCRFCKDNPEILEWFNFNVLHFFEVHNKNIFFFNLLLFQNTLKVEKLNFLQFLTNFYTHCLNIFQVKRIHAFNYFFEYRRKVDFLLFVAIWNKSFIFFFKYIFIIYTYLYALVIEIWMRNSKEY